MLGNKSPVDGYNGAAQGAAVPTDKLLYTVRECANLTSLSEKTILRLIQRRKLRCLSSTRHKRIPASELARFIRDDLS
jgi:excisionase family DNA binding protein